MSETPTDSAAPLQFDQIETGGEAQASLACQACAEPLHSHYFELNGLTVCERCRYNVEQAFATRGGPGALLKATLYGLGGGLIGAAVYYAVLVLFKLEISLLSILVGWLAGTGVAKGSGHKGGWLFQTLAIGITYFCIISTYVPFIIQEIRKDHPVEKTAVSAPAASAPQTTAPGAAAEELTAGQVVLAFGAVFLIAAIAPFLQGARSILGLLIIGIGLYQAWKLNRKVTLTIQGPYQIRAGRPVPPALAAPTE